MWWCWGPLISDNSLVLQDLANELRVPCIGWTGAHRFASDYCFTVANGDIPTEGVMCAQWLHARGIEKVGMFWEQGSSGRDYADYFRDTALGLGLKVMREVKLEPNPQGLKDDLALMRDLGVEGIYYGGYGYATFHFAEAFKALDWDPPRVMGTAFMFYSNSNRWAEGLEGWHGVDQLGEDGANPNYNAMVRRFERRFGRTTRNVVVALAYDTARVAIHGIGNAAIPSPAGSRTASSGSAGCRPPTAVPAPTSSSAPTTARATRATSSPSASCAAASCASTATTGPSGPPTLTVTKVYIHELIDVIGHNRVPAPHDRQLGAGRLAGADQRCYGVWSTMGSTGRWPRWSTCGSSTVGTGWAATSRSRPPAAATRTRRWPRGGRRRDAAPGRARPHPGAGQGSRPIDELCAAGVRGDLYCHEIVRCPRAGRGAAGRRAGAGRGGVPGEGLALVGAFRTALRADDECVLLWACPDWAAWGAFEQAWTARGLAGWRKALIGLGAPWRRTLLVDGELAPLRIGRQPRESDRRPLDEI